MERLTGRDKHEPVFWIKDRGAEVCYTPEDRCFQALSKLVHYEDLEEAGRLIKLPCAVGDTVWEIVMLPMLPEEIKVSYDIWEKEFRLEDVEDFGETVFLTEEEAEAKIKELENK